MKYIIYNYLIIIQLFFGFHLLSGGYYHGGGIQLTTEGQGVYYKPILMSGKNSQITFDAGMINRGSQLKNNTSVLGSNSYGNKIDIALGYNYSIFKNMIAGTFRPIGVVKMGGLSEFASISKNNILGEWIIKYMLGIGIQFYNGNNLNELAVKYHNSKASKGNIAFMFTFYWL